VNLTGAGAFHELERGLEQLEILLVLGRVGAIDLYPLPRARGIGESIRPRTLKGLPARRNPVLEPVLEGFCPTCATVRSWPKAASPRALTSAKLSNLPIL
jgi:hypothetical protein